MAITKAIFVVAGFGTRFLPITKSVPKEMLAIVDKPIIQYLVEEAVECGIKEVIFVTGRGKHSIENHFDKSYELEQTLVEKNKSELLEEVEKISKLANFAYVRQPVQKGDGHALLCAKPFIDPSESVLVVFPDYLMPKSNKTFAKMIDLHRRTREIVLGTDFVPMEEAHKYGVLDFENLDNPEENGENGEIEVKKFVEKPKENPPSNLISNGYSIITPEVWKYLENAEPTTNDVEIRVADAFVKILEDGKQILAVKPVKNGYDCGTKIGFLKATVDLALERNDLKDEFWNFLQDKLTDK